MKRIFFVTSIFFLLLSCFSLIFPEKSFAGCVTPDPGLICIKLKYTVKCVANNIISCCTTQQECDDVKSQPTNPEVIIKCDSETGINTAIGCIHVLSSTPEIFLADILKWAVGIGGGIAFLLILYAGFMIMTAAGNPERLKAGQEILTSAISGLILLIFSIFILKFIGVDILGLCNFGFGTCL